MWFVTPYKQISLQIFNHNATITIHYTNAYYYTFAILTTKKCGVFCYTPKYIANTVQKLGTECTIARFKYLGKAYRISKRNKMLHINMHYPTFKYVIWNNVKLKHKRKKKKLFRLIYHTHSNVLSNLFANIWHLRIPNTYTRRGIYNNVSIYYNRKQKMASRR